jgi:biopolymer transport protein ExbB
MSSFISRGTQIAVAALAALTLTGPAMAAQASSLQELLQQVRSARGQASAENQERIARFQRDRNNQRTLLAQAQAELRAQEARSERLKTTFDANEQELTELQETLRNNQGNLGELFGVVRQMAGDIKTVMDNSLVSAQIADRTALVSRLAQSRELPNLTELEGLWLSFLEEMTESGRVVRFDAEVVRPDGTTYSTPVVRVGVFNAVYENNFLNFIPETDSLQELPRQPQGRFRSAAEDLYGATSGYTAMAVDPSSGQLLGLLIQKPSTWERVQQGKTVGYVILFLGAIGLLLALFRFIYLTGAGAKIRAQRKNPDSPDAGNALGRILAVYHENKDDDVETLELKLDEAILQETPRLETMLGYIKLLAAVAPLLGLLGTVTGMIETFQSITLFGTGDPKLMAGGISQALVTTVLGLVVSIPMVLLHTLLASMAKSLVEILEEQSAGIIATQAERG